MKIRIKFAKYGVMKFIGHLDVMRFFQKAIRRADIDIKYSEGFSPHQIMSFAAPLGVGIESVGEYLDIEVNSMTSVQEMKKALGKTMVEGMSVLDVTLLPDSVKNAMASVAAAEYLVVYKAADKECIVDDTMAGQNKGGSINDIKLTAFLAQESIMVTKTTKKSVLEIDIKPGILEIKTGKGVNLPDKDVNDNFAFYMLLDASSSGNIKPSMVMEELFKFCDVEYAACDWQIIRLETYTKTAGGKLIPLADVGK
ncbi:MAG: TIGR03936 family radical SAM-associated protein [Clostridiales bacterium]|nr:TIGR03936 family radical SAM-associated protein [Clostridiales bacterium]